MININNNNLNYILLFLTNDSRGCFIDGSVTHLSCYSTLAAEGVKLKYAFTFVITWPFESYYL